MCVCARLIELTLQPTPHHAHCSNVMETIGSGQLTVRITDKTPTYVCSHTCVRTHTIRYDTIRYDASKCEREFTYTHTHSSSHCRESGRRIVVPRRRLRRAPPRRCQHSIT